MKRKNINIVLGGLSLLSLISCKSEKVSTEPTRPNVIYIFPDQMRNHAMEFWSKQGYNDKVNFTGDPVHTPNLNQFADESLVLSSAISNCPLSSPHRGMFLTGMYPENSGVTLNCNSNRPISSLKTDTNNISDVFSMAGYDCAYIGKLHADYPTPNDPANPGHYVEDKQPAWDAYTPPKRRHGFNYWYSYGTFDVHKHPHYWDTQGKRHDINQWSPIHEADMAIAYLQNKDGVRDPKKPFFMVISMNPPHSPYGSLEDCMEEDYNLYKDKSIDQLLIRPNVDLKMKKTRSAPYYFASVTGVDREFGRILQALKDQGLDKNTIVVFTSDHGETMCSQGIEDPKNSPYNEAVNVPFLIRYPEKIKPRVDNLLLSSPDIMPTLLGLCGLGNQIPSTVEGLNHSNIFFGKSENNYRPKGALYIKNADGDKNEEGKVISYFPVSRGIITHQYTLTFTIDKKNKTLKETLLFDNVNDPYQLKNLSPEKNKDIVDQLTYEMARLLKQANDPWFKEEILQDRIPYSKAK